MNKDRVISFRVNEEDGDKLAAIVAHVRATKLDRNWSESEVIRHIITRIYDGLPSERKVK